MPVARGRAAEDPAATPRQAPATPLVQGKLKSGPGEPAKRGTRLSATFSLLLMGVCEKSQPGARGVPGRWESDTCMVTRCALRVTAFREQKASIKGRARFGAEPALTHSTGPILSFYPQLKGA